MLGVTAVHLWTAAGFVAFSYSTEQNKGAYISMQWGLLSVGSKLFVTVLYMKFSAIIGTIASFVAFGINYNASVVKCPDSVYIVFIILMCLAFFVAFFGIVEPSDVRRVDGTVIAHYEHKSWHEELKAQRQIFMDWRMLVLIPPMFGSEIALIIFSTLNCKWEDARKFR